jgi:hypothetical protein
MVFKKEGEKHCNFCSKKIFLKKDHFVLIGTYNRTQKPDDEQFFHFQCFVDYWNVAVTRKAKLITANMQKQALQLFNNPMIRGLLSQIQGSDQLFSMLSTPLSEKKINYVKRVSQKIQNDRTKKRSAKRKAKMQ